MLSLDCDSLFMERRSAVLELLQSFFLPHQCRENEYCLSVLSLTRFLLEDMIHNW